MRTRYMICGLALVSATALAQPALTLHPYTFKADDGTTVQAQWGELTVPRFHDHPHDGSLKLAFVLFPAANPHPGAPIVYLAGGPGGSGIDAARGKRFPLFMALRKVADVIALDQRGTGASDTIPQCAAEGPMLHGNRVNLTRKTITTYYRSAIKHCMTLWRKKGIDLSAYNTRENALDLESLREALGVKKLNLWGISYGSTLALAALKLMPQHINRVVLASPLGMNQTVRLPSRTQDFLERVAALIQADPELGKIYPDLLGMMKTVLDRLAKNPVTITLQAAPKSDPLTLTVGKFPVQAMTVGMLKDPAQLRYLPASYGAMFAGHFQPLFAPALEDLARPATFSGMPLAVRALSCLSPKRAELVKRQAKKALLGNALNFDILLTRVPIPSAKPFRGDFCNPVHSTVPALVLTGTLDGRTYPAGHAEILKGLPNGEEVVIENAGHDLFMTSPKVTTDIVDFLSGEPVKFRRIKIPPPDFLVPPPAGNTPEP